MANAVIGWVKENPVAAGAVAVGFVVIVMMFSGGGSSEGDGGGTGSQGVAAYYGAVANQAAAGAAIQMEQIKANATTNQTLIAASYGLEKEKLTSASTNLAIGANRDVSLAGIASNERLGVLQIETQHAIADNLVALENSRLGSNERIAKTNAKIGQQSTGQQIAGVVTSIGNVVSKFI